MTACVSGANAQASLDNAIAKRLSQSNQSLLDLEKELGKASREFHDRLNEKEQEIKSLRERAAALQRLSDEQILGIEEMEKRVEQWSAQSKFQRHLLASFLDNNAIARKAAGDDRSELFDLDVLNLAHQRALAALSPDWTEKQVIAPNGEIRSLPLLALGPVNVVLEASSGLGGIVETTATGDLQLMEVLNPDELAGLQALRDEGVGTLAFDPTLGNARKISGSDATLWEHLRAGGVWAVPIVFFGVLALVIALLKAIQLMRLPKVRADVSIPGAGAEPSSPAEAPAVGAVQRKLLEIARTVPVSPQRDDLLVACLMENRHGLERYMGVIGTTAAVAPLLGLLGTVSGMISTFKMMTIFGSGDATTVSGGISEALVTTELGLIVAIPALVVSALLTRRIRSYTHQLETFTVKLSKAPQEV